MKNKNTKYRIQNIEYKVTKAQENSKGFVPMFLCPSVPLLVFTFCFLNLDCYAQPASISSTELINNSRLHDGITLVYAGEAIGDVMMRGDFAWVNVSDGNNAIGIWMSRESAGTIKFTGSHRSIGDRLEITGVFHRNCTEHGGDMDIHAREVRIITPGKTLTEQLDIKKRNTVYIILGALFLVVILVRRRKTG
jgi:hypothetical protein